MSDYPKKLYEFADKLKNEFDVIFLRQVANYITEFGADLSDTQDAYDWKDPEQNPYLLRGEELARLERRLS